MASRTLRVAATLFALSAAPSFAADTPDLWALAKSRKDVHVFATLFTAQDVRDRLKDDAGIDTAVAWCKATAVTHAFVETFRDGTQAERAALEKARDRFRAAGLDVSGCITPTQVGKLSTGWKAISCYTDRPTQDKLQAVFEFAAGLFDEIMIDDFWFTDCACKACDAARLAKAAVVGENTHPVAGDTWEDYRCELMVRLSQDRILAPARRVNPKVRVIIKYPQWYDQFHERGYEVVRETADFDRMWVGTETRDYADRQWGGTPPYEAYFIMRWLGGIGGAKCGGGWYDPFGTTARTYVEQARQTVLGGARESLLFCYGALQNATGPKNVEALRACIPELFEVAAQVRKREPAGVAAYKPPNSHPEGEKRIYDFVGMMGIPLVPCHAFPADAPAAFLPVHAAKDGDLPAKLSAYVKTGRPVLATDGLARKLEGKGLEAATVRTLSVKGSPKSLLELPQAELDALRAPILAPWKTTFQAPNRVALYLFTDGSWAVENFNDGEVEVTLNGEMMKIAGREWKYKWKER
jgi:hypothetical protein